MEEYWKDIETGNTNAYSQAYIFYYKKLYNYGRKFTDDVAMIEDAIQEVFIMIWTNREKLSAIHSPQSYLFFSFRNSLFKKTKRSQKIRAFLKAQETGEEFAIDSIIINKEKDVAMQQQLEKALKGLTSRQKEAIFLRFYEELSYEEVADIMSISIKATYKIVARALLQLKAGMEYRFFTILLSMWIS